MAKRKQRKAKENYDLDIVIPVYGRPDLLRKCLNSIEATRGDIKAKILLIDDKGPDQKELGAIYHTLNGASRVSHNKQNLGFPKTVNNGIALGNAPLVLILNTDIELEPDCLQTMMAEFEDKQVGVVGPKLLFPLNSGDPQRPAGKVQHAGLAINFNGQVIHSNIGWSADHPKVNERRILQAVTGACLMTRRKVCREVVQIYRKGGDPNGGVFNEVYSPGTFEDVEFCFAARSIGHQVIYTPKAVAYHHVGASVQQGNGSYPIQRNEMIFKARCGNMLAWDEWRFY